MTKLQAHRGVSTEAPENTMPAFLLAIDQGYDAIELDPIVTKDLQVVLHHDNTIGRTGRNPDGITSPHLWIIELYRQMGGYLITMATDSHTPSNTGKGFSEGVALLKKLGFRHVFYYKDRMPVQCTLI